MNKFYKDLWLKALRSKEYKQGKFVLRNSNNSYCCLGVLCDIVKNFNIDLKMYWIQDESTFSFVIEDIDIQESKRSILHNKIIEITKLSTAFGTFKPNNLKEFKQKYKDYDFDYLTENDTICLSQLNDRGVSFEDIANLIEEYF